MLDWEPMYLEQVKHMDLANSSWSFFAVEIAGIFGTILCGWLSDKVFKGRRGPVTIIYMLLVMLAVYIYWNSASAMVTNVAMAAIGFLIYGPVMLIGVSAVDLPVSRGCSAICWDRPCLPISVWDIFSSISVGTEALFCCYPLVP